MTTLTFHLARALGRGWGPGDEVVITELDHHANVAPWRALAARARRARAARSASRPKTGSSTWTALERGARRRAPGSLAIGAASNALGTINDLARRRALARAAGALIFVDAVHLRPARAAWTSRALDCDFLACSAYKFYGPHVGVLYGRRELLEALDVPKLDPGTRRAAGAAGDRHPEPRRHRRAPRRRSSSSPRSRRRGNRRARPARRGLPELHARGQTLVAQLWDGLRRIPGSRVYGRRPDAPAPRPCRSPSQGSSSDDGARRAGGARASSSRTATSTPLPWCERLGLEKDGLVRAGCACYTTEDEVTRLVAAVREIARR